MFRTGRVVGLFELKCGLCSNWWVCLCGVRGSECGRDRREDVVGDLGLKLKLHTKIYQQA